MKTSHLLTLTKGTIELGPQTILESGSLTITRGTRYGLVGTNGCGKSTLLRTLAGELELQSGGIACSSGLRVSFISQHVNEQLAARTVLDAFVHALLSTNASAEEWQVYGPLTDLRISEELWSQPVGTLSGGELRRVQLGMALVSQPDLLLLDEPTNFLDMEGITQYAEALTQHVRCGVIIASHDRSFLEQVTDHTIVLRNAQLHHYGFPYKEAMQQLVLDDAARERDIVWQERELTRLEAARARLQVWATRSDSMAKRYQAMCHRVERFKATMKEREPVTRRRLLMSQVPCQAKYLVQIDNHMVQTPCGRDLCEIDSLVVKPGERLALTGANGTGKSTLLKQIVAATKSASSTSGVRCHPNLSVGYFDQLLSTQPQEASLINYLGEVHHGSRAEAHSLLATAGFPYEQHQQTVGTLSGGERARLQFLYLSIVSPLLLILDEPTNHLDIEGIEELEGQLAGAHGTLLFVSHDREFLDRVATRTLCIEERRLRPA